MTKPGFSLRGWLVALPIALLTVLAVWTVGAQTSGATIPSGPISTGLNSNFSMSNYTAYPAGINALSAPDVPPIIMLVMSRDEQLFNKAYSDYTDLNNDGTLDTTYLDSFTYNGYFDPNICYTYTKTGLPGGGAGYQAAASVSVGVHECASGNSYWSGNFLNWVAMSRLDIIRWTLYGGTRQTDTATATVLERAEIPVDLHSWAKVYSGSDIKNLTPFTTTTTFCNTSGGNTATATGIATAGKASSTSPSAGKGQNDVSDTGIWTTANPSTSASGVMSTPFIRTATGAWNDWASTAKVQCMNPTGISDGSNVDSARPPTTTIKDYVARVQVCQSPTSTSTPPVESFCVAQPNGTSTKPEGLLQKYSKGDNYEKHFGLVTASSVQARGAGQVRRNVGMLEGNGSGTDTCHVDSTGAGDNDEFDSQTGQFCYKEKGAVPYEGIVYTVDRFQISGWTYETSGSDAGYYDYGVVGSTTGCTADSTPWGARGSKLLGAPKMCPDFGNPLAAMYATTLQYLQGSPVAPDTSDVLPHPVWTDPYGTPANSSTQRNAQCAGCSIVLISSGLNTFDGPGVQTLPSVASLSPTTQTGNIFSTEQLSGNYLLSEKYTSSSVTPTLTVGNQTTSDMAACLSATISNLNSLVGICNGAPGQQGGYLLAGMSLGAWNAAGSAPIRSDSHVPSTFQIKTYGVALSDNLPSFTINVGSGSITLSPSCRSTPNNPAAATNPGQPTSCYIGSVQIGAQSTYNLSATKTGLNTYGMMPSTGYTNVGSYYFVWEDSQYGSDHDQDVNNIISYCVGGSCKQPSTVITGGVAICDPVVVNGAVSTADKVNSANAIFGGACNSNGTLAVSVGDNDVLIRNQIVAYSSSYMYVGYSISGTTADGLNETYITNGGSLSSQAQNGAVFNCNLLSGSSGTDCKSAPVVQRFTLGTAAPVAPLPTPMWYAAKYSGFSGTTPSLPAGQDPSNYFFARNAGQLKAQLDSVFQSITSLAANNFGNATTPSSSNDVQGDGLAYQVQYYMQRNGVNWTGDLLALWTDSSGYQREGTVSSTGNQELDSSAAYVVNGPDKSQGALPGAMVQYRCSVAPTSTGSTNFDPSASSSCSPVSASNPLIPAWDAGNLLNAYYDPTSSSGKAAIANLALQRDYGTDSGSGSEIGRRYIFTYLPTVASGNWAPNGSTATGTIVNGVQTDFVWNANSCSSTGVYTPGAQAGFCGTYDTTNKVRNGNYSLLNEASPTLAQELVNWVRGVESTDYRSRTTVSSNAANTYRLGDIIDSSPMIVGTPAESYDTLYNNASYGAYRLNYTNRRQMVYVGGNDGMLHAFNGGFYVPAQTAATVGGSSSTSTPDPTAYRQLPSSLSLSSGDSNVKLGNNWTLGQEVWAFIPGNLLPHLRWLADKNYTHVFYVDGSPVASDVQLWGKGTSTSCLSGQAAAADIDTQGHVCGWGTVIVVPFRLGGGYIQVDTVGGTGATAATKQNSNAAYVVLDVTDPEIPPTVLGEITTASYNATSGYTAGTLTTSAPSFVAHKETDGLLHFLLAIASGPGDNGGPLPSTNSTGIPNNVLWCGTSQTAGNKVVQAPCNSTLGVSIYDLSAMVGNSTTAPSSTPVKTFTNGPANSFAGDLVASDFNLNFSDEAVYFGVTTNPTAGTATDGTYTDKTPFSGGLYKIDMNTGATTLKGQPSSTDVSDPSTWLLTKIMDLSQPVTIRPTLATDSTGRPMIYFGTGRSYTQDDNSGNSLQGTQQQYIYAITDVSLLTGMPTNCLTLPISTTSLYNSSTTTLGSTGTIAVGKGSGLSNSSSITDINALTTALSSTDTVATDTNYQCYVYNGWMYALTPGVQAASTGTAASTAQPSERVVSSQVLYAQILLTPTYIPPGAAAIAAANSSVCNPIPVPGTSNLYGMNYLTGTASIGMLSSFGAKGGVVNIAVSLGSGLASSPVLHTGNNAVSAAFGLSGGTTLQNVSGMKTPTNAEISWREPATNQ
ncbi:hypothetical protein [Dyella telluris]|uniref:PilC beta-propeller domain-containing protein n=1 Tax=Dyella telluris TaxID=2763498 RepID=A0A7G8Q132_9GAMM|nr:hypothetical protein [Dyella telluris]QNK00490.1 hypothetical protein H8F01_15470 [Dyella telluris]